MLAGTAFAVAFALLAPSRDAFTSAPADTVVADDASPLDPVRLAYLRARAGTGELGAEEAFASVTALAREGRLDEARTLLAAAPSLELGPGARLMLDLELAAGTLRRAAAASGGPNDADREVDARTADVDAGAGVHVDGDTPAGTGVRTGIEIEAARDTLHRALRTLLERPALHEPARLERAATIAAAFADGPLAAAFHERLAAVDPDDATGHLTRCGRSLAAAGDASGALGCLERARAAADDADVRFGLALELLALLPPADPDGRRRALVEKTLEHRPASVAELEALATTLLAIERPDAAARAYARLADIDAPERARWLADAARWSEAAGKPAEAAVFLDALPPAATAEARAMRERRIVALLVGAGRTTRALERAAERVAARPDDPDRVRAAVDTASEAGDTALALGWNTAYLARRPDDVEALRRQTRLALALGRPDLALAAAERASSHSTESPTAPAELVRLARLAEWAGEPERALAHRRRLAARAPDADNLAEIARLAEALRRPAVAAAALAELARDAEPDENAVRRLVRLHELDGRPDAAAAALEAIMARHGERAATLRALAELHVRHVSYRPALAAWERYAARVGRAAAETLARVELHWRLDERDAAVALAAELPGLGFGGEASDYQTNLLAGIGWRYRLPEVAALARPLLASLERADRQLLHGRRAVDALESAGELAEARREAEALWRSSGSAELGLTALRLAIDGGDDAASGRLLADTALVEALRAMPAYHSLRATDALRRGEPAVAERAYRTALGIDADSVEALAGLLWLHVGERDVDALAALLEDAADRAADSPGLWTAFAVGHVEIGDAEGSLPWFERALADGGDGPRGDYGLILTWADALEAAGRPDHARRVRRFAVAQLRPEILEAAAGERDALLRQYGRVLARHGGGEANEAWMRYVLNGDGSRAGAGEPEIALWREDMAISWLMATERHEHARLLMARRHERRLATPVWQDLALALRTDDEASVRAALDAGTGLSAGDRILALRKLGRDADAWTLALRTLDNPRSASDRDVAREHYAAMRRFRPSDATATARRLSSGELSVEESGFALRHTHGPSAIGVGVDYVRRAFDSDRLVVEDGTRSAVALSLFREGARQGFGLTAGVTDDGRTDVAFGQARYARRDPDGRREAALELAWNEDADESAELRLAGVRDRVTLSLESALGERAFARLSAEADEIRTRVNDRRLARGFGTRAELGLRGGFGAIAWSGSVVAADVRRSRVERLPYELRLGEGTTLDAVLPERASSLSLNGSLSRGGVGDFPGVASPRWYVNGGIGQAWPERALGAQLDAGVGVRVIGDDELALAFTRDARLAGRRVRGDLSTFGLSYRHRF